MSSESSDDDVSEEANNDESDLGNQWIPRDILRRTNWLYRIDALRNHDIREMQMIWDLTELCEGYATQFIMWSYAIKAFIQNAVDVVIVNKLQSLLTLMIKLIEILWSEGYCYLLDFVSISYYPVTNRFTRNDQGPRFREKKRMTISEIGVNEAYDMTGLSVTQLHRLYHQLRIP